jgi:hypothetical protein
MQRPGAHPENMLPADFLCDFCGRAWDGESPIVEGHRGSLICGDCLAAAYRALVLDSQNSAPAGYQCRLCLESRPDQGWVSPAPSRPAGDTAEAPAAACARCIRQSAAVLAKDKDYHWQRPT